MSIDCCVDASFALVWAEWDDKDNARLQTGGVIRIDDVPVAWSSKKQTLSSTEAKLIAPSTAMRESLWV